MAPRAPSAATSGTTGGDDLTVTLTADDAPRGARRHTVAARGGSAKRQPAWPTPRIAYTTYSAYDYICS